MRQTPGEPAGGQRAESPYPLSADHASITIAAHTAYRAEDETHSLPDGVLTQDNLGAAIEPSTRYWVFWTLGEGYTAQKEPAIPPWAGFIVGQITTAAAYRRPVDFDAYRWRKDVLFRELSVATNLACLTGALRFTAIEAQGCMTALRIDYGRESESVTLNPDLDDWEELIGAALGKLGVPKRAATDFIRTLTLGVGRAGKAPRFAYNAPPQTPLDLTAAMERLRHAVRDAPGNTGYARTSVYVEDIKLALDAWASLVMIEALRRDEGASVHILCDNPEAISSDVQCAVEICDDWTGWEPKRFYGRDVRACLEAATAARNAV